MDLSHKNMIVDLGEDLVSLLAGIKSGNITNPNTKIARLLEIVSTDERESYLRVDNGDVEED
jgi:hypothetical protein